jgi:hypothetical protein
VLQVLCGRLGHSAAAQQLERHAVVGLQAVRRKALRAHLTQRPVRIKQHPADPGSVSSSDSQIELVPVGERPSERSRAMPVKAHASVLELLPYAAAVRAGAYALHVRVTESNTRMFQVVLKDATPCALHKRQVRPQGSGGACVHTRDYRRVRLKAGAILSSPML